MCVLCGQLISEVHWTEHRVDATDVGGAGAELARRRDRFQRTRVLDRVLDHYGLDVFDDWSATSYVVSNRKGASELVRHLGELWPAAERLSGRRPDPLDVSLIERLEGGGPAAAANQP